jgi:hypothetical protein
MKIGADYLELANQFEMLALFEKNPKLKADFEKQAAAYRKLAEDRQEKQSFPPKIAN